jgi:hypothetical protein
MSDIKKNASENSPAGSEPSVSDKDLSNVFVSESELVGDDMKSLNFGKSLFDESKLQWMIKNRMLEKADVRLPPQNETVPRPEPDECVVFRDHFTAGLRDHSKSCDKFYRLATYMQSARDFCEEYIAVWIWPLKKGWDFVRFHEKLVKGKTYIFSDNEVFRPKKYTEDKDFCFCC